MSLKSFCKFLHRLVKLFVCQRFCRIRYLIWANATKSCSKTTLLLHFTFNVFISFDFTWLSVLWRGHSNWWHTWLSLWIGMLSNVTSDNTTSTSTSVIVFALDILFIFVLLFFLWFLSGFFQLTLSAPTIVWLIDIVDQVIKILLVHLFVTCFIWIRQIFYTCAFIFSWFTLSLV